MAFSEFERRRVQDNLDEFIAAIRPPAHIRNELDIGYRIHNQSVIIFEIRPRWDNPDEVLQHPVAKTTYVKRAGRWKIYWMRADLKWHRYQPEPLVDQLVNFLDVVKEDEYGCFWG